MPFTIPGCVSFYPPTGRIRLNPPFSTLPPTAKEPSSCNPKARTRWNESKHQRKKKQQKSETFIEIVLPPIVDAAPRRLRSTLEPWQKRTLSLIYNINVR